MQPTDRNLCLAREPLPTPLGACHALGVMFMWGTHSANEYLAEFCGDDETADELAEVIMDACEQQTVFRRLLALPPSDLIVAIQRAYSGALRAGVSFAACGSPETEATGHWPLHDPLSRDVMVFGEGNGSGARLRQNPRAAELAAWAGFRRLTASRL